MMETNAFFHLDAPVQRVTGLDIPTPYAYNLEELSLEFVEISELKTSKNLFGPVMYGTGVRM